MCMISATTVQQARLNLLYHKLPLKAPNVVRSVWAMDPYTGEEH